MIRPLILLAGIAALGACSTGPKIVKVPVPVTCQTPPPVEPEYPAILSTDGLYQRVQKLIAQDKLREAYIIQLRAWGLGCNV